MAVRSRVLNRVQEPSRRPSSPHIPDDPEQTVNFTPVLPLDAGDQYKRLPAAELVRLFMADLSKAATAAIKGATQTAVEVAQAPLLFMAGRDPLELRRERQQLGVQEAGHVDAKHTRGNPPGWDASSAPNKVELDHTERAAAGAPSQPTPMELGSIVTGRPPVTAAEQVTAPGTVVGTTEAASVLDELTRVERANQQRHGELVRVLKRGFALDEYSSTEIGGRGGVGHGSGNDAGGEGSGGGGWMATVAELGLGWLLARHGIHLPGGKVPGVPGGKIPGAAGAAGAASHTSGLAKVGKVGGVLAWLTVAFDAIDALGSVTKDQEKYDKGEITEREFHGKAGKTTGKFAGGAAGGLGGWYGGAALGAMAGTAIAPGIGTTIGAIAGGIIGAATGTKLGAQLGGKGGEALGDKYGEYKESLGGSGDKPSPRYAEGKVKEPVIDLPPAATVAAGSAVEAIKAEQPTVDKGAKVDIEMTKGAPALVRAGAAPTTAAATVSREAAAPAIAVAPAAVPATPAAAPATARRRGTATAPITAAPARSPAASAIPAAAPAAAAAFIAKEEGRKLGAYSDAGGQSIGYGHSITAGERAKGYLEIGGERVALGQQLTPLQATRLFDQDITKHTEVARGKVGDDVWTKLNQSQKTALADYTYNTGTVPTGFADAVRRGDMTAAADTLRHGIATSQHRPNAVLARRREHEAQLFAATPQAAATASATNDGEPRRATVGRITSAAPEPVMSATEVARPPAPASTTVEAPRAAGAPAMIGSIGLDDVPLAPLDDALNALLSGMLT